MSINAEWNYEVHLSYRINANTAQFLCFTIIENMSYICLWKSSSFFKAMQACPPELSSSDRAIAAGDPSPSQATPSRFFSPVLAVLSLQVSSRPRRSAGSPLRSGTSQ